ncbi:hypothetical protein SK128_021051, partial [Halocaridina rubra]
MFSGEKRFQSVTRIQIASSWLIGRTFVVKFQSIHELSRSDNDGTTFSGIIDILLYSGGIRKKKSTDSEIMDLGS